MNESGSDFMLGAKPTGWLGAPAVGGLTLPAAEPTPSQMYAPRGVWLDEEILVVADTGNHRVLIWHDGNPADHSPADVVLGQKDFVTEGAQAGGRGPENGMRLPTGVLVADGALVVADAWNHRVLVWNTVPRESDRPPDRIIGQANAHEVDENRGGPCGPLGFYWPFGLAWAEGRLYVADTGNRRVLAWDGIPEPDQLPELILGQDDGDQRDENRGELGPSSFRWPHDIAVAPGKVTLIADAGNHRVLGWKPRPDADRDADQVLGQHDFHSATEFPYTPQTADIFRFPYAIATDTANPSEGPLVVADTANNRVLVWGAVPTESTVPADLVLGQPDFGANGENRWTEVAGDTFCWPYGVSLCNGRLAVADSGNNRVTVWELG